MDRDLDRRDLDRRDLDRDLDRDLREYFFALLPLHRRLERPPIIAFLPEDARSESFWLPLKYWLYAWFAKAPPDLSKVPPPNDSGLSADILPPRWPPKTAGWLLQVVQSLPPRIVRPRPHPRPRPRPRARPIIPGFPISRFSIFIFYTMFYIYIQNIKFFILFYIFFPYCCYCCYYIVIIKFNWKKLTLKLAKYNCYAIIK